MPRPERHLVKRWQVLIAGAGTLGDTELYGRAIVADSRLEGRYVGPTQWLLTFKEPGSDESLFAYAFLMTRVGTARNSGDAASAPRFLGLRKDLLRNLPIPKRRSVNAAHAWRAWSDALSKSARCTFASSPRRETSSRGTPRDARSAPMCADRVSGRHSGTQRYLRFRAGTLPRPASALAQLRKRWPGRLRDVLQPEGVFNGPRFARVDCQPPHGIDFYSQRDVFLMRPIPRRIARPSISDRMLFVPRDAVLAGSHGQLTDGGIFGKVELASFGAYEGGLTQDLLRLLFVPTERSTAFAFLSTMVGRAPSQVDRNRHEHSADEARSARGAAVSRADTDAASHGP